MSDPDPVLSTILKPVSSRDALEEAQLLGRLEAESFDAALRERERHEREERLTRLVASGLDSDVDFDLFHEPTGATWRLRQDVARLSAFHQAVLHSRAWRLIQAARRLVGRAW
jgi:hypothetical protein